MASPVKAILAGTAVVGVGGTGIWMVYSGVTPEWRPLVQDSEFWTGSSVNANYSGKYGDTYSRLLVGTGTTKGDAKVADNKAWWDWAYSNFYKKDEAKGGFQTVVKGSKQEGSEGLSLQEACDNAYKSDNNKVKGGDSFANDEFKDEQFWKFCSAVENKPKSIGEMTESGDQDRKNVEDDNGIWKDKLGGNNKTVLLAIHAKDNQKIWEQLDLQFKSPSSNPSGFFTIDDDKPTIKDLCSKAYESDGFDRGTDSSKPKEDEFYKWCSLKGRK